MKSTSPGNLMNSSRILIEIIRGSRTTTAIENDNKCKVTIIRNKQMPLAKPKLFKKPKQENSFPLPDGTHPPVKTQSV